jgi:hypothetical protein
MACEARHRHPGRNPSVEAGTRCCNYCYIGCTTVHFTLTHSARILPLPERPAHRRLVFVMAFLYTLGWIAPLFHHHELALRSVADASIAVHTCGDVERHIPIDAFHGCEVCWQANQRVTLPASEHTATAIVIVTGRISDRSTAVTPRSPFLLPDKRGPPAVA